MSDRLSHHPSQLPDLASELGLQGQHHTGLCSESRESGQVVDLMAQEQQREIGVEVGADALVVAFSKMCERLWPR